MNDPWIGRAVVVEMMVNVYHEPFRLRWAFRYIWATWSLVVEFGGRDRGRVERWELVSEKAGPRTELQVRLLYELAADLRLREYTEPIQTKWPQVKENVLPKRQHGADAGLDVKAAKELKKLEQRAVLEWKLAAAKAAGWRRKNLDPETVVLQAFLQRRVTAGLVCQLFDLDWKIYIPFLLCLQDAYDRLVREALGSRCLAIVKAHRAKKLTLQEAADLLALNTPAAEDILRIGSIWGRKHHPAKWPTNKQLVDALESMRRLRSMGLPQDGTPNDPEQSG